MEDRKSILSPRESGKFIAETAKDIFILEEGVKNLANEIVNNLKEGSLSVKNFSQHVYHPDPKDPRVVNWIFVIDALNFCFWKDSEDLKWKVNGETGYFALCAAIKRATQENIPITDASYLSKVTLAELKKILRGDDDCAVNLIEERVKNLNEVGTVLLKKYNGSFSECIKYCEKSAEKLLKLIVEDFPCFRDEAVYKNKKLSFYKRAQILIGDIWACFQGEGIGAFNDIECITMFPDYRVPQVLVFYGAMRYSNELYKKLESDPHLDVGCTEEIEIRGCSIEAVERIVAEARKIISRSTNLNIDVLDCNSVLVDHFLWDYRRAHVKDLDKIPYHKVLTIFY